MVMRPILRRCGSRVLENLGRQNPLVLSRDRKGIKQVANIVTDGRTLLLDNIIITTVPYYCTPA